MTTEIIPPSLMDISHIPRIADLSCHGISIRAICTGTVEIATQPPGADIYIYEEVLGDYVLQSVQSGTFSSPATISGIECTSLTRSNKFKLSRPGCVNVEGILEITDGGVYPLNIYMETCTTPTPTVPEMASWFLPGMALAALIFLFAVSDKKKRQKPKYEEKYKEIYE